MNWNALTLTLPWLRNPNSALIAESLTTGCLRWSGRAASVIGSSHSTQLIWLKPVNRIKHGGKNSIPDSWMATTLFGSVTAVNSILHLVRDSWEVPEKSLIESLTGVLSRVLCNFLRDFSGTPKKLLTEPRIRFTRYLKLFVKLLLTSNNFHICGDG